MKTVSTAPLIGCWVNGKLRYQSRNRDSVHAYAHDKMRDNGSRDVWVAPVGSFVDGDEANRVDSRKARKIAMNGSYGKPAS